LPHQPYERRSRRADAARLFVIPPPEIVKPGDVRRIALFRDDALGETLPSRRTRKGSLLEETRERSKRAHFAATICIHAPDPSFLSRLGHAKFPEFCAGVAQSSSPHPIARWQGWQLGGRWHQTPAFMCFSERLRESPHGPRVTG